MHLACILSTASIFTANCRSVELVQRKYRPAVERSCAAYVSAWQISMVSASTSASYHGYAPKLLAITTKLVLRNCSGLWLRLWCRRLISSKARPRGSRTCRPLHTYHGRFHTCCRLGQQTVAYSLLRTVQSSPSPLQLYLTLFVKKGASEEVALGWNDRCVHRRLGKGIDGGHGSQLSASS